jgi:hypothetical protein
MKSDLAIAALIRSRMAELGLSRDEFAKRLGEACEAYIVEPTSCRMGRACEHVPQSGTARSTMSKLYLIVILPPWRRRLLEGSC